MPISQRILGWNFYNFRLSLDNRSFRLVFVCNFFLKYEFCEGEIRWNHWSKFVPTIPLVVTPRNFDLIKLAWFCLVYWISERVLKYSKSFETESNQIDRIGRSHPPTKLVIWIAHNGLSSRMKRKKNLIYGSQCLHESYIEKVRFKSDVAIDVNTNSERTFDSDYVQLGSLAKLSTMWVSSKSLDQIQQVKWRSIRTRINTCHTTFRLHVVELQDLPPN